MIPKPPLTPAELDALLPAMLNHLCGVVGSHIAGAHPLTIQSGPFVGMKYINKPLNSALIPKLLGSYECNLHAQMEAIISQGWRSIVNIGAGEGYYAVGLALRMPQLHVLAFEATPAARQLCGEIALLNNVQDRITIAGESTLQNLRPLAAEHPLILCDCEGGELELLDPEAVPGLRNCEMLIELHDFLNPAITSTLLQRFGQTHKCTILRDTGRNPAAYPALQNIPEFYQYVAILEHRPQAMSWGHFVPNST
jgi:hypothetical protein